MQARNKSLALIIHIEKINSRQDMKIQQKT